MDSTSFRDAITGYLRPLPDAFMDPRKVVIGRNNQEKDDYRIEREKMHLSLKNVGCRHLQPFLGKYPKIWALVIASWSTLLHDWSAGMLCGMVSHHSC